MQDRSDGEEESDEDDDDGKRLKPDDLGIDHCLELGQEAAHVGEVYEKVPSIIKGTVNTRDPTCKDGNDTINDGILKIFV